MIFQCYLRWKSKDNSIDLSDMFAKDPHTLFKLSK